jgi:hypothetical protein
MVFSKHLLEGIRRGRITFSIRIWTHPHVKVGGRYPVGEGQIVVDSIVPMDIADITDGLARESGFKDVRDLLNTAQHGKGRNVYLIRFHYLRPGAWDQPAAEQVARPAASRTLLQRIRSAAAPRSTRSGSGGPPARTKRGAGH